MADAEIYDKGPGDKTAILNIRRGVIYDFDAPNWVDLRVGAFLSITDDTGDDTITGLSETITNPGVMLPQDRYWIGLKTRDDNFPRESGSVFVGFTNSSPGQQDKIGDSRVTTSDVAVGTTNAFYWRPNNSVNNQLSFLVADGTSPRLGGGDNLQQHFIQDATGAGTVYATLLAIQLKRDKSTSNLVTAWIKSTTKSADMLFSNTPTAAVLQTQLETWTTSLKHIGPMTLSAIPDALYLYWPYRNSRLRIHAVGVSKAL